MTNVFSAMNSVSPIWCPRSVRIPSVQPKHPTRCHRSHYRKNTLPFFPALLRIQLHSMNLVLYKHHIFIIALCCDSRTKPIHDKFQKALLGNWCQRGRERSHQSLITLIGGERYTSTGKEISPRGERILKKRVILKDPRCLAFKRRDATCLLEGKDMFICAYFIWALILHDFAFCSNFLFPIFSQYPMSMIQGEQDI